MSRNILCSLVLALAVACSPSRPSEGFRGEVTDPAGDIQAGTSPPRPDLIGATIDVDDDDEEVRVTVSLAPGTFDINTSRIVVYLDVDESPATGVPASPGLMVDYWIDISNGRAALAHCPTSAAGVCSVVDDGLEFTPGPNGAEVIVRLEQLGDDEGRMGFRVVANPVALPGATDFLPDVGLSPGRVR